jgi:predicted glycoside hydrolase/deacetylase ChbG (UPF0249 family)
MNRPTRLIINADDFGLHGAVNQAVFEGATRGIITSCSLIATTLGADRFDEAVRIAKDNPSLDVGCHFAMVGLPGLPAGYREFLVAFAAGRFPPSRIAQLLHRQIDRIERAGIHPSHIDSHQHLHALPAVMRVVCDVAVERGIPAVRVPMETGPIGAPRGRAMASRVLALPARISRKLVDRAGLWRPDHFLGMAISGGLTASRLTRLIEQVPAAGVTEILCHPATDNAPMRAAFNWGYDWEGEFKAITDASARAKLNERGIELTTFAAEATVGRSRSYAG